MNISLKTLNIISFNLFFMIRHFYSYWLFNIVFVIPKESQQSWKRNLDSFGRTKMCYYLVVMKIREAFLIFIAFKIYL
ncbi:hypothetical protein IO89_02350 [Epilithonimonas lactis]|uniref:Uncharacterized protein n=1 Tax=Epilithonimonas lactis TaxID=421072 RepID=A0A085BLV1_9FLAO|nr:hypothetical protein IO89_02350 [Epilithonimonas lactis]